MRGQNSNGNSQNNNGQPIIVNIQNTNMNANINGGAAYPYKKKWIAFLLCFFGGFFGLHRFYVGKAGTGIIWLLTGGLVGIGWILDCLLILFGSFRDKAGYPLR